MSSAPSAVLRGSWCPPLAGGAGSEASAVKHSRVLGPRAQGGGGWVCGRVTKPAVSRGLESLECRQCSALLTRRLSPSRCRSAPNSAVAASAPLDPARAGCLAGEPQAKRGAPLSSHVSHCNSNASLPPLRSVDRGKGDQRLGGLGRAPLKIRDFGTKLLQFWLEPAPVLHPTSFPHLPFSLTTRCCFSWVPGSVFELPQLLSFPWRLLRFWARLAARRERAWLLPE